MIKSIGFLNKAHSDKKKQAAPSLEKRPDQYAQHSQGNLDHWESKWLGVPDTGGGGAALADPVNCLVQPRDLFVFATQEWIGKNHLKKLSMIITLDFRYLIPIISYNIG